MTAQSSEDVVARIGGSIAHADLHQGVHVCWDGLRYTDGCLVTDPELQATMEALIELGPAARRP